MTGSTAGCSRSPLPASCSIDMLLEARILARRARWRREILLIALCLLALTVGLLLFSGESVQSTNARGRTSTSSVDDAAQVRQALQDAERQVAVYETMLQQERGRSRELAEQLARHSAASPPAETMNSIRAVAPTVDAILPPPTSTPPAQQPARTAQGDADLVRLERALVEERNKVDQLRRELVAVWRELRSQMEVIADRAAQEQELIELRRALEQSEAQAATYEELLAQERAHALALAHQLAGYQVASDSRSADLDAAQTSYDGQPTASTIGAGPPPSPSTVANALAYESSSRSPVAPVTHAPSQSGVVRLMARAALLLDQGNISAAQIVLERAAEADDAGALFALAETYDPLVLAAWRTLGTLGDPAKARSLYARALAGGVAAARSRIMALGLEAPSTQSGDVQQ